MTEQCKHEHLEYRECCGTVVCKDCGKVWPYTDYPIVSTIAKWYGPKVYYGVGWYGAGEPVLSLATRK